jgi:hypothetical protein
MLPTLLFACADWIDKEPACDKDVYTWSDDLMAHILAGDGSGAFDYNPEDTPRKRIFGAYDPQSGDFEWKTEFAEEYWLKAENVNGYGTAYHNGDEDLELTRTRTDKVGDTWSVTERLQRVGCNVTRNTWTQEDYSDLFTEVGTYGDDDSLSWIAEDESYDYYGAYRRSLARTWNQEGKDDASQDAWEYAPAGTAERTFHLPYEDGWMAGSMEQGFSGSRDYSYDVTDDADDRLFTVTASYDYDGDGTEVFECATGKTITCEATTGGGECTRACDNGRDLSCDRDPC